LRHLSNQRTSQWILLFLLILFAVLFFWGGPDYYSPRSFKNIWNLGHIVFYTLLFLYLLQFWLWYSSLSFYRQVGWGLVLTLFTGIGIELIQIQFSRLPEFGDIWRNILGCMLALIFFSRSTRSFGSKHLKIPKLLIIFFVLLEFSYPVISIIDEMIARKQFPLLSGFETPFEMDRWEAGDRLQRSHLYSLEGKYSAQILLDTDRYSGVALIYFPHNWQNYKTLHFSVYNPDNQPLSVTCRIHDWEHIVNGQQFSDRFNKRFILNPGWNEIIIPMGEIQNAPQGRLMNLKQIYNFGFFASNLKMARTVYLDDVRLEY